MKKETTVVNGQSLDITHTKPPSRPTHPGARFDYVAYDEEATHAQKELKAEFAHLESAIERLCKAGRAKALALTSLEESYMWVGKSIRDDQIARNGSAPLQEGRTNS